MNVEFDMKKIGKAGQKQWDNAVLIHNMTPEHTEIIGQFLDYTGLSPTQLIMFLGLSVIRFNAFGWNEGKTVEEIEVLKRCRHECKIDCLLKEYERVKDERDKARSEKAFLIDRIKSLIRSTMVVERDMRL